MFTGFRTQILLWTIFPLGIILAAAAYFGVHSHQTAMREMVAERQGAVARVAAAQWSESLVLHALLLRQLDPPLSVPCNPGCAAFEGGIALFDSQGNLLQAQPSNEMWRAPRRRAQIASLLNTRDVAFSLPFIEDNTMQLLIAVPQGNNILMGAFVPPPMTNLGFGAHGVAYLVDARGKIIVHPNSAELGQELAHHEGIAEVMRGETGATFHQAINGAENVIGYASITPTNWGLLVDEPWAEIDAPMFASLLPLMLALAAMLALGAVYFGVRNIVRPLQSLTQAADRIANGDYHAVEQPVGGLGEIETLRETLAAMAHKVSAAQGAMQNYITAITRGQEDERLRLARELHDDTIQSLIALQQRVELTQKAAVKDPTLALTRLNEFKTLLTETLASVRRFVSDLRPTYLADLGLVPALEQLARQANARFEIIGEETRLDAERELAVYRIAQEALRNIAKHAYAKHVSVTVAFDARGFTVTIEDDGVGFAPPETLTAYAQAGHFGLMGMQERAQLFGGNVSVKSEYSKGTKVVCHLPVETSPTLHF